MWCGGSSCGQSLCTSWAAWSQGGTREAPADDEVATCKGDKPAVAKAWQAEKVSEEVLSHLRPAEDVFAPFLKAFGIAGGM